MFERVADRFKGLRSKVLKPGIAKCREPFLRAGRLQNVFSCEVLVIEYWNLRFIWNLVLGSCILDTKLQGRAIIY